MINEDIASHIGLVADVRKALLGLGLLIATLPFYLEFETSRNLITALVGILAFSAGLWLLSNEVVPLTRYRPVLIPFSIALFFFLLWLESPLNDALLDSELARIQIRLTTMMSTAIYTYFPLIMLLAVSSTFIGILYMQRKAQILISLQEVPWIFLLIFIITWLVVGFIQPPIPNNSFLIGAKFEYSLLSSGNGFIVFPEGSKANSVTIDSGCSGVHSLALFTISYYLALMYFYTQHSPNLKKLMIGFIVGTLGTLSSNWIRIAAIFLIGYFYGTKEMLNFHDYAGLMIFLSWMLIFWMKSVDWMLESSAIPQINNHEILAKEE